MNFEKLNTRLTFVANIGVVIGLIFLVAELRQSNQQAAAATEQDRSNTVDQQFREYASSDYLPDIFAKMAESGVDSLSNVELLRARAWETARIVRMTGQLSQYQEGYLDEEIYQTFLEISRNNLPLWKALGLTENGRLGIASVQFLKIVESTIQESE